MPIPIILMIIAFFVPYLYIQYERHELWHKYLLKVAKDKHWHAWGGLVGTSVLLVVVHWLNWSWWVTPLVITIGGLIKECVDKYLKGGKFDLMDIRANYVGMIVAYVLFYLGRLI